jgi:hypothetical protein
MKFEALRELISRRECFDFSTLLQLSTERRPQLRTQLHRWVHSGKLVALRRGLYAFAPNYRRTPLNPAALAEAIYPPSYLSLHWALGFYGLIPEQVVTYTSVTTRQTNHFANALGSYDYRHVRPALFTSYERVPVNGEALWLASPEKALLDTWYLESGPWTEARMREMRFQNFDRIEPDRLHLGAGLFASRRIDQAVALWLQLGASEDEKGVEL